MHCLQLAWALKVNPAILGARLAAHIDNSGRTEAFHICVQQAQSSRLKELPDNVVSTIIGMVREQSYNSSVRNWQLVQKCIRGDCDGEIDHGINPEHYDDEDQWFYDKEGGGEIEHDIKRAHKKILKHHLAKIKSFEKASKAIVEELHVHVEYRLVKAARHFKHSNSGPCSAYLTIPIGEMPLTHEKGPDKVSYVIQQAIKPHLLQPLSIKAKERFKHAVKTLRLNDKHADIMINEEWWWKNRFLDYEEQIAR